MGQWLAKYVTRPSALHLEQAEHQPGYEVLASEILTGGREGGTPLETFAERKNVLGVSEGTLITINRCLTGEGLIEKEGVRNYVRRDAKLSPAILAAARALAEAADKEGLPSATRCSPH